MGATHDNANQGQCLEAQGVFGLKRGRMVKDARRVRVPRRERRPGSVGRIEVQSHSRESVRNLQRHALRSAPSQLRRNTAGMCSFRLHPRAGSASARARARRLTHHLCTPSLPPPPPSCSSNCRIPNSGLALPYREVKTSPTQTTETPPWWCQTCCQMDPPWDGSCKSMTAFSIDIYGFALTVGNRSVWPGV